MTDYDCECVFYLGIQISKTFGLEKKWLLLDEYYNGIKIIYEDYKKYDDKNKSLLDSINDYIDDHTIFIISVIKNSVEESGK